MAPHPNASNEEPEEIAAESDPRQAGEVRRALKRAARRDPHPDVLKPIGRICFFISVLIAPWLLQPFFAGGWGAGNAARSFARLSRLAGALDKEALSALASIRLDRLLRLDLDPKQAVALLISGIFLFAAYYFLLYIVAMNLMRLAAGIALLAGAGTKRRAALPEQAAPRLEANTLAVRTPAGGEPKLG